MQNVICKIKESKIYIFAPAGIVTGGVELLHQLCDVLNSNGKDAFIVYYGANPHEIPSDYRKYNIKIVERDKVFDSKETVIIVPETRLKLLNEYQNSSAIVWWMSVDNYFTALQATCFETFVYFLRFGLFHGNQSAIRVFVRKLLHYKKFQTYSLIKLRKNKNVLYNAFQSEYAKCFLHKHGIRNTVLLSDYINSDYIFNSDVIKNKENLIIYNPKKGLKFTNRLINAAPDFNWVPIQNMTRAEVKETMMKAKIYIDFGHFPGKDRMPREAAMCGCCIITGKLGAAGFFQDLPIDDKYKFNNKKKDVKKIIERLNFMLNNYEKEIIVFDNYRKIISIEKQEFIESVKKLFIG